MIDIISDLLYSLGLNVSKAKHTMRFARMRQLLSVPITLVIDVGANTGQYAAGLRKDGYEQRIVSFEPLVDAYKVLQSNFVGDGKHSCYAVALGEHCGGSVLNVAENSASTSLLPITQLHTKAAPQSITRHSQVCTITSLDEMLPSISQDQDRIHLKIDVQGYEYKV